MSAEGVVEPWAGRGNSASALAFSALTKASNLLVPCLDPRLVESWGTCGHWDLWSLKHWCKSIHSCNPDGHSATKRRIKLLKNSLPMSLPEVRYRQKRKIQRDAGCNCLHSINSLFQAGCAALLSPACKASWGFASTLLSDPPNYLRMWGSSKIILCVKLFSGPGLVSSINVTSCWSKTLVTHYFGSDISPQILEINWDP